MKVIITLRLLGGILIMLPIVMVAILGPVTLTGLWATLPMLAFMAGSVLWGASWGILYERGKL